MYKNELRELPDELGGRGLPALRVLNLFTNKLRKLSPMIGTLACLEELNAGANKLMVLPDETFSWLGRLRVLTLFDNNLVRIGSLAPCVSLEEVRLYGNNLEAMPVLPPRCPCLTVLEVHKNRIAEIDETYFDATPALSRLLLWGNQLRALPASICGCAELAQLQLNDNHLGSLPSGSAWPSKLETLFLHNNASLSSLPSELAGLRAVKRCNLSKLPLDGRSEGVAGALQAICMSQEGGIFWGANGKRLSAP